MPKFKEYDIEVLQNIYTLAVCKTYKNQNGEMDIYYLTKKQLAKKELNRLENQNETTTEKEKLINDFFEQMTERINIIEKAESLDLKEFLNSNSLYEIFDDKKFEKYINPQNIKENIPENVKGNEHEFSREKER